ncbi:MAG: class I SAM-dependent methyltransferase [Deltaproteobacteria bacterium]|nr:class I SAM-dependent methyltransferase [Deltaproteobacteria bacterium]
MGLIFDAGAARLYEAWYQSPQGRAMDQLVKDSVFNLLELQPGERILDIGCGEGNHLLFFSRLGFNVVGLDASSYMVRRARERLGRQAVLEVGEAEDLPYEDNEFDVALFINTIEFLNNPIEALREAGRVARRRIFITVTNSFSWYCLVMKLKHFFRESLFTHAAFYNLWELKSYLYSALGDVPIKWRSAQVQAPVLEKIGGLLFERRYLEKCPFASFLALSATIQYTAKTIQTPLKVRLGKAGEPAVEGAAMGEAKNERSFPL